jgi:hypothetical protein
MYSIEALYNKAREKYPSYSSYLCFAHTVQSRDLNRHILHKWFNRLVEHGDYALSEKKRILAHLEALSTP